MIALVAAVAENGVIGTDNDLPWHLPDDMKYFREITMGKTVVMGRKTFESIVASIGKPLPDRTNLVLTRNSSFTADGVQVLHDAASLADLARDVYVIGGAQVYAATIDQADTLYITEVKTQVEGDAVFPAVNPEIWAETSRVEHAADERHAFPFDFVIYKRKQA